MTSKADTDSRHEVVMENGLSSLSELTGTVSIVVKSKGYFFIVVTLFSLPTYRDATVKGS